MQLTLKIQRCQNKTFQNHPLNRYLLRSGYNLHLADNYKELLLNDYDGKTFIQNSVKNIKLLGETHKHTHGCDENVRSQKLLSFQAQEVTLDSNKSYHSRTAYIFTQTQALEENPRIMSRPTRVASIICYISRKGLFKFIGEGFVLYLNLLSIFSFIINTRRSRNN